MFRPHCTKQPNNDRRIWTYPSEYYSIMHDITVMRARLVPVLYTAGRQAYDSGVGMMRPLYYEYPERDEAYAEQYKNQYFLGDDIMVAPITEVR